MAHNILKLNAISPVADKYFLDSYNVGTDVSNPDGIMLRSFNMHEYELGENLLAVARAGAGVNNIPIDKCAEKGIVVFNTPGANANAVKELVLCNLLLASRKITAAIDWVKTLKGKGAEVGKLVEKGKSNFVGGEIQGKKLGIIGLGAIGGMVANAAIELGMEVYGYDPFLSVDTAWTISRNVKRIDKIETIYAECDYITIHVPFKATMKDTYNKEVFAKMKHGAALINCSRGELVNNEDVIEAVKSGKLSRYVTDFPADELIGADDNIICIPHLGASTPEAEDNCAEMAARQLVEYIENGNIINSVNYPNNSMPRSGDHRVCILHYNKTEMLSKFTQIISNEGVNIESFSNRTRNDYAYCIVDICGEPNPSIYKDLMAVEGVIKVRII